MDEKRQESQKTVVAFVAGLLIGGLLVWVFTSASGTEPEDVDTEATQTTSSEVVEMDETVDETTEVETTPVVTTDESFTVPNQAAGDVVWLGENVSYPSAEGWIVVHEEIGGGLGNALGAARYETAVGLSPVSVKLLRATEAGSEYHVVYYSESGDDMFDIRDDAPLKTDMGEVVEATFTAE